MDTPQIQQQPAVVELQPQGIQYSLTIKGGADDLVMPLPMQPSRKRVLTHGSHSLRYTFGDIPIREHTRNRSWSIMLSGQVGLKGEIPGLARLRAFDQFLLAYHSGAQRRGSIAVDKSGHPSSGVYLVLNDTDDSNRYLVEVDAFEWDRSIDTSRVGIADWQLTLHAYSLYREEPQYITLTGSPQETYNNGVTDILRNAYGYRLLKELKALAPPTDAQAKLLADQLTRQAAYKELDRAFDAANQPGMTKRARDAVSLVRAPARAWRRSMENYRASLNKVLDLTKVPLQVLADVVIAGEQVTKALTDVRAAGFDFLSTGGGLAHRLSALLFDSTRQRDLALRDFTVRQGNAKMLEDVELFQETVGEISASTVVDPQAVTTYVAQTGDTWATVAYAFYGDVSLWFYLASYNGVVDTYTQADGSPALAGGTVVLIPGAPDRGISVSTLMNADALYGTDLAFDFRTGDFALASRPYVWHDGVHLSLETPEAQDLAYTSGVENFRQALLTRLLTARGDIAHMPTFGLFTLRPGQAKSPQAVAEFLNTLTDQFEQDHRVVKVKSAQLESKGDRMDLRVSVVGVAGGQVGVAVPLS